MKTFIKKTLIVLTLVLLSGCGQKPSDDKVQVEFWTLQLNDFKPYITNIISEYEKSHPNVEIKWIDVPFTEGDKRILASIMSNKVPDLVNLNPSFSSTLAAKGTLSDISTYSDTKNLEKEYIPQSLSLCTQNGEIYCIPWYITSSITMYNQEITDKANIKKIPLTYAELGTFAKQVKEKTHKYPLMPTLSEDGYMLKSLYKQGLTPIDSKKREVDFHNQKTLEVYNFWANLYQQNYIPKESITQTHREALEKYMSGDLAMIQTGANFLKIIKENAPDIYQKTRVAPQFDTKQGVVDFSMMNLIIPEKSQHKKEALDFALFLTNSKNQLEFSKLAPILPSSKKALEDSFFNQDKTLLEKGLKISADQLKSAPKSIPLFPQQKEINNAIDYSTQEIMLKKSDTKDILKKNELTIKNILGY